MLSKFSSRCQRASFISYNKVIPLQLDFVLQWNLICDRAHVGANVQAGYAAGMLVGSFVFGAISDIFGRRFCMLLCSVLAVRMLFKDNTQDCEQSLFFFRFSEGSACARERRATARNEDGAFSASCPLSRAWPLLSLSRFARRTKKKE